MPARMPLATAAGLPARFSCASWTPPRSPCDHEVRKLESPYLQTAQRKRCSGSSVAASSEMNEPQLAPKIASRRPVHPVERAQVVRRGQAVLRVAHADLAVQQPLEVAAVAGRAAVVRREPGVALVHEVLRVPVPLVAVRGDGAAVRVHDRGCGLLGRGARRPEEVRVDLDAVERPVGDLLRARRAARCGRRAAQARARSPAPTPERRPGARAASPGPRTSRRSPRRRVQCGSPQAPPGASSVTSPDEASTSTRSYRPWRPRVATRRSPSGCQRCSKKSASSCVSRRAPEPSAPTTCSSYQPELSDA